MRHLIPLAGILALLLAGCASTTEKAAEPPTEDAKLPYPQSIYVYDFAVAPADVRSNAVAKQLGGAIDDPTGTPKREALERAIARELAIKLVANLQKAGLPAVRWQGTPPKNKDAYIMEGQFLTTEAAAGQAIVGFSLGAGELDVLAQVYHLDEGQKQLFRKVSVGKHGLAGELPAAKLSAGKASMSVSTAVGSVQSVTSKVRKAADETAATIVDLLKPKMQEQGWF